MKKIIIILFLLAVVLWVGFWIWQTNQSREKIQQNNRLNIKQVQTIEEVSSSSTPEIYKDSFLGLEITYPSTYELATSTESEFDRGQKKSIFITNNNNSSLSLVTVTPDYTEGVGEGCCFYFPHKPLDIINQDLDELEKQITSLKPLMLVKTAIGGRPALHFYSIKEYVTTWVEESWLVTLDKLGYSDLLISGNPIYTFSENQSMDLSELQKEFNDYLRSDSQPDVANHYKEILYSINFEMRENDWIPFDDTINNITFSYPKYYQPKLKSSENYTVVNFIPDFFRDGTETFPLSNISRNIYFADELYLSNKAFRSLDEIYSYYNQVYNECVDKLECSVMNIEKLTVDGHRAVEVDLAYNMANKRVFVEDTQQGDLLVLNNYSNSKLFKQFIKTIKFK